MLNILSLNRCSVGTIVAADQNAQSRASDQGNFANISLILIRFIYIYIGPLLIQGIVAAEQNARSGASDQGEEKIIIFIFILFLFL